ncbi:zinc-binding dehydrogenase [Streptomyces venetus]|uniref:zinc-binding dehydrogenase n=1 Tax=Streptomyces venetus TaxID=1701086 RepID=UPI003C306A17
MGAHAVIDHRTEDVPARATELTGGRGVDTVVDTVGPHSATADLRLLVHCGRLAAVAGRPDLRTVRPFGMAPSVHEIALGAAYTLGDERTRARLAAMLTDLLAMTAQGRLDAMLTRTVALDDVPEALIELSGRHVRGKIVYVRD